MKMTLLMDKILQKLRIAPKSNAKNFPMRKPRVICSYMLASERLGFYLWSRQIVESRGWEDFFKLMFEVHAFWESKSINFSERPLWKMEVRNIYVHTYICKLNIPTSGRWRELGSQIIEVTLWRYIRSQRSFSFLFSFSCHTLCRSQSSDKGFNSYFHRSITDINDKAKLF